MPPAEVLVRAPGRVNLIGEHTDHQGGHVLPFAIGRAVQLRARLRPGVGVRIASAGFAGAATIAPEDDPASVEPRWARSAAAVVRLLREAGLPATGFDAEVTADLPAGAGLSSSAAFDVAVALAAVETASIAAGGVASRFSDRAYLAALCRDAEALGAGVRCGLMDPFAVLHGAAGHAVLLDCRSHAFEHVQVPPGMAFVVADSGRRRLLAAGAYERRRSECEEAARRLGVEVLRDATPQQVAAAERRLGPTLHRRARHVVTENARVLECAEALRAADAERVGRLLDRSHESLRDDFEVSCPELDSLVAKARRAPGVLGSRLCGAGFGGSTITAVREDAVAALLAALGDHAPFVVTLSAAATVERCG